MEIYSTMQYIKLRIILLLRLFYVNLIQSRDVCLSMKYWAKGLHVCSSTLHAFVVLACNGLIILYLAYTRIRTN
jgi:hypothetical protein